MIAVSVLHAVRRKVSIEKLLVSVGLAIGVGLIVFGFTTARTGRDAQGLPDEIESIAPAKGDQVLRQSTIEVDLVPGYRGVLVIDGQELPVVDLEGSVAAGPGDQVNSDIKTTKFEPGNNTLTYQPQEGAPIAQFATGLHEVQVIYWKIDESREASRSYTWQFEVI
jgi:hypothetical protein